MDLLNAGSGSFPLLGGNVDSHFLLSDKERRHISILVVESDVSMRNSLRQALVSVGYEDISDAPDLHVALQKMEDRDFSHVIFEAKNSKMPARDFLLQALQKRSSLVPLPTSYNPTADDVFNLLIAGARGFIVKPFTAGSLDESIVWATKGEPLSESILYTRDRNEALASLILSALDKLALVIRQSKRFETAKREIPKRYRILARSMELARTFMKGGDPALRKALMDLAIERSNGTAPVTANVGRRSRRRHGHDSEGEA